MQKLGFAINTPEKTRAAVVPRKQLPVKTLLFFSSWKLQLSKNGQYLKKNANSSRRICVRVYRTDVQGRNSAAETTEASKFQREN
jgi:hypothetical protein